MLGRLTGPTWALWTNLHVAVVGRYNGLRKNGAEVSMFQGWPPGAFTWFEGLLEDNSKAYFTANRATYDNAVRGPLLALLEDLSEQFGPGKIFRPNRDIRFS